MTRQQAGWALIIGGALGVAGGLFLPWATLGALSLYGSEGDGLIAAIAGGLGILAGLLTVNAKGGAAPKVLGVIAALGTGGVGLYDYTNLSAVVGSSGLVQVGTGLYAVIVAGIVLAVGTVFTFRLEPEEVTLDKEAAGERAQQLVEEQGLEWRDAWAEAKAEAGAGGSARNAELEAHTRLLMQSEGLTWKQAWAKASRAQMRKDQDREDPWPV